ncbi:MAG: DUF4446 family protein [Minisyncoccia bacterium]
MLLNIYILIGALALALISLVWIIRLEIKLHRILGEKGKNLDEAFSYLRKDVDHLKHFSNKSLDNFNTISKKLKRTVSGLETIRFNPFKGNGSGGNQSFATAFVNEDGDGVIISSLYSSNHVSVFSKPIKNMSSEYELTTEEKTALQKAKESIK